MNFTVACDGESGPAERFRDDVQGMHVPPPHHLACRKTPPSSERHGDGVLVLWRAVFLITCLGCLHRRSADGVIREAAPLHLIGRVEIAPVEDNRLF